MEHSFNIEAAKEIGIIPAILLKNIYWWVKKNEYNNKHFYDGHYWTYNSVKAFTDYFPYLTAKQILYALKKLETEGYLVSGNYNNSAYDRTKWYAVTKRAEKLLGVTEKQEDIHLTKLSNGNDHSVKPIPDIKTDSKQKSLPTEEREEAGSSPTLSSKSSKKRRTKKTYRDVLGNPEYYLVQDALSRFIKYLKGMQYTPSVTQLEKWADFLLKEANGDPCIAYAIVDQSINNQWKGLFKIRNKKSDSSKSVPGNIEKDGARDENGELIVY